MGFARSLFSNVVLESSYNLMVWHRWYTTLSYNLGLLLHKDFHHPPSSSKSTVQDHVQQPNQTNELNIARYKKAVSTAIWLQLTLIACYLPYGVASAFVTNGGKSSSVSYAWIYTSTIVLSNSSINPILYCWKLDEVRQAVKDTIRQVLCRYFSS